MNFTGSNNGPNTCEISGPEANIAFLERQNHCDVTFCVGPTKQEIKCHAVFLMAKSNVFETMFSGRWKTSTAINLPDTEPEVFWLFLKFIYGDKFTTTRWYKVVELLELAHKYNVKALLIKCEDFLIKEIKLDKCIELFKFACLHRIKADKVYSLKRLVEKAGNTMARSLFQLSNDGTIFKLDEETWMYLLRRDDLPLTEIEIFKIVLRWGQYYKEKGESCKRILENIIPLIRFPLMTVQEFVNNVIPKKVLPTKDVLDLFKYFHSQGSLREKAARRLKFSSIPRKGQEQITFELYEVMDLQSQLSSIETIWSDSTLACVEHHKDIYEISWNPGQSPGSPQPILKLASLMLQGLNYDLLRSKWPEGCDPGSTFRVTVSIKMTHTCHSIPEPPERPLTMSQLERLGWVKYTTDGIISKGNETEIMVEPPLEIYPGLKYHIVVEFQDKALVVVGPPTDNILNPRYDVWTNSHLKSACVEPSLPVSLIANVSNNSSPQNLHVVRGLKFLLF